MKISFTITQTGSIENGYKMGAKIVQHQSFQFKSSVRIEFHCKYLMNDFCLSDAHNIVLI